MMRLSTLITSAVLLYRHSEAFRATKTVSNNVPVKLDMWKEIADGLRLQDERDRVGDGLRLQGERDHVEEVETFDWRVWRDEHESKTFVQAVDHLNAYHQKTEFLNSSETTFHQRYWINTKAWTGVEKKGPLFFIISPYGGFSTYPYGFIGEMSRDLGAMVVQIEGRFTPGSLPFNVSGFDHTPNRVGLLSSENALRDYVMLISHLRDVYDPEWVCPTATFGGSLAGMYASWLRVKFPHIIDIAFASGSPVTGYPGTSDTNAFSKVITDAWLDASGDAECIDLVRDSFKAFHEADACKHKNLFYMVFNEAAYNSYPPNERISNACKDGLAKRDEGGSAAEVGMAICGFMCEEECSSELRRHEVMWSYLSCTQFVHPIGQNGVTDFFWPPEPWSTETRRETCMKEWGVGPQVEGDYHTEIFGFHHLPQLADNMKRILFSFGTYDPWTGFAISEEDISPELPVVMIKGGTHGADYMGRTAADTPDMLAARKREQEYLTKWVEEVQQRSSKQAFS